MESCDAVCVNKKAILSSFFYFSVFKTRIAIFEDVLIIFIKNIWMKKGKHPPFFETFFLKTILDIYFCPFSENKIECWKRKSHFFVFFFDDIFSHFIMITSKSKKHENATKTISEKTKKSGKIREIYKNPYF